MNEFQKKVFNTVKDMHPLEAEKLLRKSVQNKTLKESDRLIVEKELIDKKWYNKGVA